MDRTNMGAIFIIIKSVIINKLLKFPVSRELHHFVIIKDCFWWILCSMGALLHNCNKRLREIFKL